MYLVCEGCLFLFNQVKNGASPETHFLQPRRKESWFSGADLLLFMLQGLAGVPLDLNQLPQPLTSAFTELLPRFHSAACFCS